MIMTSHAVSSIGNIIDYCLQPSKISNILHSDGVDLTGLSLDNKKIHDTEIVKSDFLLYQNSRLKNPYLSLIISPEIDLPNKVLKTIVDDTLKEMKLDNHQMIAITHTELRGDEGKKKPIKHIHLLINRVDYDGKTFNDKYIGLKGIQAISKVAIKHNLRDVYHTRSYDQRPVRKTNSPFHEDKARWIEELRSLVNPLIYRKSTQCIDDIFDELINEHNIDVDITQYKNGSFGVVLKKDGHSIKMSDVSRYLTVQPSDDGSYQANKLLQPILDKNIRNSTEFNPDAFREIKENYDVHKDEEVYQAQLIEFTASIRAYQHRNKDEEIENEYLYRRKKKRKQIGFKVQI